MFTSIAHPDADTLVYSFSTLLLVLVFGSSLLLIIGGIFLRRRAILPALGFGLAAFGFVGLLLAGPIMVRDRVTVTRSSIYQNTGFWFAPNVKGFEFKGVDRIVIARVREKEGEPAQNHWFIHRGRQMQEIDPGDLWDDNADTIIPWLEQCGVKFAGHRN